MENTTAKVQLLAYTPDPEKVVAAAGKGCYSSEFPDRLYDTITNDGIRKFIKRLMSSGHLSPMEHASFTFAVSGVSRALLAQITRHRIASFSVSSQRYIMGDHFGHVLPDAIAKNEYARRVFDDTMDEIARAYRDIHAYLMSEYLRERYGDIIPCDNPKYYYLSLDAYFKSKAESEYSAYRKNRSAAEKFANENARAVLPNATATNFVVTMNARELLHFFSLRCCNRAQDEIRALADEMLKLCQSVAPNLFENAGAPCVSGACPEGAMTCGKPRRGECKQDG